MHASNAAVGKIIIVFNAMMALNKIKVLDFKNQKNVLRLALQEHMNEAIFVRYVIMLAPHA